MNEIIERQLDWRYATKRFDSTKQISDQDWQTLERSIIQAPSSFGLQPWRIVVVRDPKIRQDLKAVSWDQPQVVEASHYIVFAAKAAVENADVNTAIERMAKIRNINAETLSGLRQMMLSFLSDLRSSDKLESWCTHQAYIALGFLLSTAAMLKVDACPMEGINQDAYDNILGLKELGLRSKVTCALGYRSEQDGTAMYRKFRTPQEELFIER